jgi:hypothetical protein
MSWSKILKNCHLGKTVICSQIVNSLIKGPSATTATTTAPAVVATAASVDTATATPTAPAIAGRPTVLYHFFDFDSSNNKDVNNCSILLQSLTAQAIRSNHDLAALVYDDVLSHGSPSIAQMRRIVPTLLATFHSVRIVVDGLDECNDKDQGSILKELIALGKNIRDLPGGTSANCKILVSSRDVDQISRHLSRRATIALGTESTALSSAIQGYVSSRVTVLVSNLDGVSSPADVSFGLEEALVGKADGKYTASLIDVSLTVARDVPVGVSSDISTTRFIQYRRHDASYRNTSKGPRCNVSGSNVRTLGQFHDTS